MNECQKMSEPTAGKYRSSRQSKSGRERLRQRSRSRSPPRDNKTERHIELPFGASPLRKRDSEQYSPLFARYLELQKNIVLAQLGEPEVKGRWKSFVKRWNRGGLAEGWYDRTALEKSRREAPDEALQRNIGTVSIAEPTGKEAASTDSGDELGPLLPSAQSRTGLDSSYGPSIPSFQDLELKRAQEEEDTDERRTQVRGERRAARNLDKERLDELVPKEQGGTKERQIEKRKELAASNKAFASTKEGGDVPDLPDTDLMGEGDDGLQAYKKQKQEMERRKSERELRRDEIMRARRVEREERVRQFQEREVKTMQGLLELAKDRYG